MMIKSKLNVTSLFYLDESILNKDFFLVPLYLTKHLHGEFNFVYPQNAYNLNYPSEYRGAHLIPIKSDSEFSFSLWKERQSILYMIKHAKKIDVLFLVWLNHRSLLLAYIYKLINRKGICFVKGDLNSESFSPTQSRGLFSIIKAKFRAILHRNVDVFSCETEVSYAAVKSGVLGEYLSDRVYHLPNCFDEDTREVLHVKVRPFGDKEDIILVVGRIGADCKNHEMILEALSGLDLNNWKVIFIGNIADNFKVAIETFFNDSPKLKDSVIFTGPIYAKDELWEYYSRSKVFLMSSDKEGFPNVFPEALRFGCFIITTEVDAAFDITNHGEVGKIIKKGDVQNLRQFLKHELISNKIDFEVHYQAAIRLASDKFLWSSNMKRLVDAKFTTLQK